MFVIGCCVGPSGRFEQIAQPSLDTYAADCTFDIGRHQASLASFYNGVLQRAARLPDLEGVILMHDDTAFHEHGWRDKLIGEFDRGGIVVAGVLGGRGPGGMAWFTRPEKFGEVCGENPLVVGPSRGEVEMLDGLFLALSPAAARTLTFFEGYPAFHGYDSEICSAALDAGGRVVVTDIAVEHRSSGIYGRDPRSYEQWIRASLIWRMRWGHLSAFRRAGVRARLATVPLERRLRPSLRRRARAIQRRSSGTNGGSERGG